jgi:hypothetical protein
MTKSSPQEGRYRGSGSVYSGRLQHSTTYPLIVRTSRYRSSGTVVGSDQLLDLAELEARQHGGALPSSWILRVMRNGGTSFHGRSRHSSLPGKYYAHAAIVARRGCIARATRECRTPRRIRPDPPSSAGCHCRHSYNMCRPQWRDERIELDPFLIRQAFDREVQLGQPT